MPPRTLIQKSRSVRPSQKAEFAQFGKAKREFFGLSQADEAAIEQEIGIALDAHLRQTEG